MAALGHVFQHGGEDGGEDGGEEEKGIGLEHLPLVVGERTSGVGWILPDAVIAGMGVGCRYKRVYSGI